MDFVVPADHRVKLKEWEKRYKYLDLTKELKMLWNLRVTIIPTAIGALGIYTRTGGVVNNWTSKSHIFVKIILKIRINFLINEN